jgi:hypothetical protein
MRKEAGCQWYHSIGLPLSYSRVSVANNNYFQIAVLRRSFMKKIRETCMPRGEFKYRYGFFADTPNIAWIVSVI